MSTGEERLALSEAYSNLLDTVWNMRVHITTGHWIDYGNILNPGTVIRLHGYTSDFWMLRNDGWVSSYGGDRTHDEMFVSMLRHRDHMFLLHKGY